MSPSAWSLFSRVTFLPNLHGDNDNDNNPLKPQNSVSFSQSLRKKHRCFLDVFWRCQLDKKKNLIFQSLFK